LPGVPLLTERTPRLAGRRSHDVPECGYSTGAGERYYFVDLVNDRKIRWPRLENDEDLMVLGSARPLLQALQHATMELLAG